MYIPNPTLNGMAYISGIRTAFKGAVQNSDQDFGRSVGEF